MSDFSVEDIPREKKIKETPQKDPDLFTAMLEGRTITKSFDTSRGTFKIKYPMGRDRIRIDQLKAIRRNGLPAATFDVSAMYNNEVFSTLDVVVIDGPEWWKNARAKDPDWSWEDCPDEELIIELYRLVDTFRGDIQVRIRQSRPAGKAELGKTGDTATSVDDGAFSGIANRSPS
jgi:hypothetical protein